MPTDIQQTIYSIEETQSAIQFLATHYMVT